MLSSAFSPWRSALSPQEALEISSGYLENARNATSPKMALINCDDAKTALSRIRRSVGKDILSSSRAEDRTLCIEISVTYFGLAELLDSLGLHDKTQPLYAKAEKWRGRIQLPGQPFPVDPAAYSMIGPVLDPSVVDPLSPSPPPSPPLIQDNPYYDIAPIPPHIFAKDMHQPLDINKLPSVEERLESTYQLAYCLDLLQSSQSPEESFDQAERNWLKAIEHDPDEQERLKTLAINVLREFAHEELKDAKVVAEVVCLVPVLEKDDLQQLLQLLFHGIEQSELLNFNLLEGLAQLVQHASPGHLNADNLVKILQLISARLRSTHHQSPDYICQLTLTVSHVLDAMADSRVKGLDREKLHAPLSTYLHELECSADPYLVYQAAYASQALLHVPDNETPWQATVRRTGKVVKGVSGLVSAVKGLDLNGFVEGLGHIQEGLAGASEVFTVVKVAYEDVNTLAKSGQQFLDCLKEGLSFSRKRVWYPALRCADVLLQNGQLIAFKMLVCEAPCRRDPAFQWGICQRLGELAANAECDDDSRISAVALLGEMYRNDAVWGQQANIKQWILDILMQLADPSGTAMQVAGMLLVELEKDGDAKKQALYRGCREAGPGPHPLKLAIPSLMSSSLIDRAQSKLDVEGSLRQLKERRLQGRGEVVYISPQAKAGLKARDDALFPLMDKVKEFLDSERKVFLLLGDSGAGKSTYNQQLECDLWNSYKNKEGRIPLFITLAAIPNPEDELIAKQLRKEGFTERQIRELKGYREFILICDGYDESRQTHNLYTTNRLNQLGEWRAQMIISCRSEYLGTDYRDRFQPVDRNHQEESPLFQEAAIAPFSKDQIQDYVKQFVSVKGHPWQVADYLEALDRIHGLKDLVTNPFMLALSLAVLPRMVGPGHTLSAARVTRVELYDQFVEQWLERGKIRLVEKVSDQERKAFENLSDEGFTQKGISFLKGLSTAIYENQAGNSVVDYSSFRDQGTWKEAFFGQEGEKKLLREACPLNRNGNQYRFLHRSLLEYCVARAVFEPQEGKNDELRTVETTTTTLRRGSVSSACSFESQNGLEETVAAIEQPVLDSPLGRKSFVGEPSILRFLVERVKQEPLFKQQLLAIIERSKTEKKEFKTVRRAATNAITILVRAGVQFLGADLQGIQIPGADLSHGAFEYAQLQRADLRKVILRNISLRGANLGMTQMSGVQFGELPFLKETKWVQLCVYSPDGKHLAVGLRNGDINIYTTSDWEIIYTFSGHTGGVSSVAFSPHGNQIVSGSDDATVRLWDVETGDCRHTLNGHKNSVRSVAYSPKGDQIASGSRDSTLRLWDPETGDCCRILSGHSSWILSVVYSPTGGQIASGSDDNTVRLWDVETGHCRHTLSGHTDSVQSVAYSPNGSQIASGSDDATLRLWDVETGNCLHALSSHTGSVHSVVYSPKGDQIASGSRDTTVRLWDAETGNCRHTFTGHSDWVRSVAFSPKGGQIASGSDDMAVRLWDTETGSYRHTLSGHSDWVLSVAYSPKRGQIASGSRDATVRLWDVETGDLRHTLSDHSDWVQSVAYSPKGDQIASGSRDATLRLWDVETGDCRHILRGHSNWVLSVAYSPKGDQIASGSRDATIRLWDTETGDHCHTLTGHSDWVRSVVYSPNGGQIASGGDDNTVRLWDVETGDCHHTLRGHSGGVWSVVYSPNGDQITSGSEDMRVQLWDVQTGVCRHVLSGHSRRIQSVAYPPTGSHIASASDDKTVRLWDVASGQCRVIVQNHAEVKSIVWEATSHGDYLVTGCSDRSARLWQVIDKGNECCLRLQWRSPPDELDLVDMSMQDVNGLSGLNQRLLKQRGAVGEPALA